MMDEKYMINSLRGGDGCAFTMIFQQFYPSVHAWVLNAVHGSTVAKDITQDIFLWLWTNRETLPEISSLKAYLIASARYKVYQLVRQEQRMERIRRVLMGDAGRHHGVSSMDDHDAFERVLAAMEYLSPAKKRILALFYLKGNSAKHISKKMGLSYQYVRNALSRGRSEIRLRVIGKIKI